MMNYRNVCPSLSWIHYLCSRICKPNMIFPLSKYFSWMPMENIKQTINQKRVCSVLFCILSNLSWSQEDYYLGTQNYHIRKNYTHPTHNCIYLWHTLQKVRRRKGEILCKKRSYNVYSIWKRVKLPYKEWLCFQTCHLQAFQKWFSYYMF